MLTVAEATTTAELERLRPAWADLWARSPAATPFQHPAWLTPWWTHVAEGDLWTLAAYDGDALVGLVPLYVYTQGSGSRDVFLVGIATSDHLDALALPGREAAVASAAFAHLDERRDRWDVVDLQPLPPASPLWTTAPPPGWAAHGSDADACPVLALPPTVDGLRGRVGDNLLQNLRYYRRRADRAGATVEPATAGNADEVFAALLRLHAARWATRGQPGVLAADTVRRAHAESLPLLLAAGLLRMYALRVDGTIAAVFYGLGDGRRVYYYLGGFDPAYQSLSPGTLLVGHAVDRAIEAGAVAFDFLKGREPYKYLWGATDTPTYGRRFTRR